MIGWLFSHTKVDGFEERTSTSSFDFLREREYKAVDSVQRTVAHQ